MKISFMNGVRFYQTVVVVGVFFCLCVPWQYVQAVTWFISDEQGERYGTGSVSDQVLAAQQRVDLQDDGWYASLDDEDHMLRVSFGSGDDIALGVTPYVISMNGTDIAELVRVHMDGPVLGTPNGTATQPKLDNATTMQDGAPLPYSLVGERLWNETVGGSSSARNALRIDVMTGITAFGAWFGDLETRTDGQGAAAEVHLLDASGSLVDTTTIAPTTGNQAACGGDTSASSPSGCGNETTRWIGFTLDPGEQVSNIVVIVGDDDDPGDAGTNDGNTEHLSMVGPTFAFSCADSDQDGVCDTEDVCPQDATKSTSIGCGCGVVDPDTLGEVCQSETNSCGAFGTGTIQCDGSCDAPILTLPERYEQTCESEPNACGHTVTGFIDCSGACYALVPELPDGYGEACTSEANTCGQTATGNINCEGVCTALMPLDDSCEQEQEEEEEVPEIEEQDTDTQEDMEEEVVTTSSRGSGGSTTRQYESYCGDGVLDEDEMCDDGNYREGDGCSKECLLETQSADETVQVLPLTVTSTSFSVIDILDIQEVLPPSSKLLDTGASSGVVDTMLEETNELILPYSLPDTGVSVKEQVGK